MKLNLAINLEELIKLRRIAAVILLIFSVFLFILSIFAFASGWYYAIREGMIPEVWGIFEGNHGPWRHCSAGNLIYFTFVLQFQSFYCSTFSLLLKKTRSEIWITLFTVIVLIILFRTHYWLID